MKRFPYLTAWVSVAVLLLSSCATTPFYEVQINALAQQGNSGKTTYSLVAEEGTPQDLLFDELSQYVKFALARRGMMEVEDPDAAQLVIVLGYAVSNRKVHVTKEKVPEYITSIDGEVLAFRQRTQTNLHTYYGRAMTLSAVDFKVFRETGEIVYVWQTTTVSPGESSDIRRVFPAMVAATMPHIGRSTHEKITVRIKEDSPEVQEMRSVVQ